MTRGRLVVVVASVIAIVGVGWQVARSLAPAGTEVARLASNRGTADIEVSIPRGATARAARGEPVLDIPSPLVVHVGDTLRIANHDDVAQYVGPFLVGAHDTVTERFVEPGLLSFACALHRSGHLDIRVVP